jgi:Cu-processing system permease protein
MIDQSTVLIMTRKEIRDAARNRWFGLFAAAFTLLTLALSWMALSGVGSYGVAGFGRTTAAMINMVLLIVPLMGITLGAMSIASDRERGALAYVMAQPMTLLEVMLGKFFGLALALTAALLIGFGLSGLLVAMLGSTSQIAHFVVLTALTILLAIVSLSVGILVSTGLRKGATAIGIALFLWLTFAFLSDLGLMGTAIVLDVKIETLFTMALLNPLQVFKMAVIVAIRDNLEVLGPAGTYAVRTYGSGLLSMLIGILAAWIVIPLVVGAYVFRRRGAV